MKTNFRNNNFASQHHCFHGKVSSVNDVLAGQCPLTGRYFEPCEVQNYCRKSSELRGNRKVVQNFCIQLFQHAEFLHHTVVVGKVVN